MNLPGNLDLQKLRRRRPCNVGAVGLLHPREACVAPVDEIAGKMSRRSPFKASGSCLIGGGQGAHRGTKKGPMGDDNDPRAIKTRKTRKLFKGGDPAMFAEGREGQDSPAGGASISSLS